MTQSAEPTAGPWTASKSRGKPGHGVLAQVYDATGKAILSADEIGPSGDAVAILAAAAPEMRDLLKKWTQGHCGDPMIIETLRLLARIKEG